MLEDLDPQRSPVRLFMNSLAKCDVALLQETPVSCKKEADRFEKHWSGECFWSFDTSRSAGVAILFSPNFSGKIICFLFDSDGRILSLLINFNHSMLNIVNIYSPCSASDRRALFFLFT